MQPRTRIVARVLALAACVLWCVAPGPARARETTALPPRAPAELQTLARGAAEWVRARMADAGAPTQPGFSLTAELPIARGRMLPESDRLRELAPIAGADRAWVLDLESDRGRAVVQLALIELATSRAVAAGRAEAPLADLGTALADAADALLAQLGSPARTPQAPSLAELGTYGRAVAEMEAGQLADAWRTLAPQSSATAQALRSQIEQRSEDAALPIGDRARLAVARGDSERARLWLRSELASRPGDPVLALAAAEAAEDIGELERAVPLYDRVLELDPGSAAARRGRTRVLLQLGRAADAVADLVAAAAPDPALLDAASQATSLDDATRAKLHLGAATELASRFDAPRAHSHLARAGQLDSSLQGSVAREAALLHVQLGRPEEALAPAEQAAQLGSADGALYQALGAARHAAGDPQGAREAFEQAHALSPQDADPLRGLGEIALEQGDTQEASKLFHQVLELSPRSERTRLMLAGLMRATGQVDGAMQILEGQPGGPTPELLREAASIRAERGEVAGATGMLEQALELAPANPRLAADLAELREASGDSAGATALRELASKMGGEGSGTARDAAELGATEKKTAKTLAGLAELASSFPQSIPGHGGAVEVVALLEPTFADAERRLLPQALRPRRVSMDALGSELAQALGTRFEVVTPAEIPSELATAEQSALRAFDEDEPSVARMNDALGTDAVFVARATPDGEDGALRLEVRMLVGNDALAVRRFANQTRIDDGLRRFAVWNPLALVVASLALVLCVLPLVRGWGELQVGIQYASLGKGFFSIKLSRRSSKADAGTQKGAGGNRFLRKMSMMGRFERSLVGKETLFRWLPARRYFVTVHGLLQDPATEEVIGNYAAEQTVEIRRGKTARLDFDFRAREAALEVCVFDGNEPVQQAVVVLRGQPDSLRYAHAGRTMFYVPPDRHRVLVGIGGLLLEREVAIDSFTPRTVSFEIHDESVRVFANCPEAVEPYLLGDLAAAADALERAGEDKAAANVRGEHFAAVGDMEQAARSFQRAGRYEEAATLLSQDVDPASAAELYERAGNHQKAAESYLAAGDAVRAAEHFEIAYRYEDALECHRRIGNVEKVCELQEKLARYYEAARAAIECGDPDRAIRNLQMIDLRDGDYVRACQMLGQIFLERGEVDLGVQKLDEAVTVGGGENAPLDLAEQLASALEQVGRLEQAIETWESIRARDFHYPNASTRIEALRKALEADRATRATIARGGEPTGETRYEILGELGRGGMGVVFKARDKRLGRVVALKRLPDNLRNHPTAVRLFLREARAAAALNHRNIVTLFDAGQEEDQYFLTMELLEGLPLHEVLGRRGRLSARDAARLGVQACAGLEYAHAQGIVHRDIKTSNLFFTKDRVVKIMDFGLAKMTEEVRRAATVVGGTPYYMAPEQAAGEDVDHRADQYALGVTLFELVTGDVPFRDGDVTYHHRHTAPPDPRTAAPDLPDDFAELILQLMAKRPENRFARTADAGAALQRIAKRLSG